MDVLVIVGRNRRSLQSLRHFNSLHDCVEEHIEATDLADVPRDHQASGVFLVEVRGRDPVEELAAETSVGVQKDPHELLR